MAKTRKHSRKRDAIYRAIKSTATHPNAEWVYRQVKPDFPDLSLGTVYRNLALFRVDGDIMCVASVDGQERFDGNTRPHAHFICERCGRVDDLAKEPAVSLPDVDGEINGYQLNFYGVCSQCAARGAH